MLYLVQYLDKCPFQPSICQLLINLSCIYCSFIVLWQCIEKKNQQIIPFTEQIIARVFSSFLWPGGGRPAGSFSALVVTCQTVSHANCCDSKAPRPLPFLSPPLHPHSTFPPTSLLTRCGEPWKGPCQEREARGDSCLFRGGHYRP